MPWRCQFNHAVLLALGGVGKASGDVGSAENRILDAVFCNLHRRQGPRHRQSSGAQLAEGRGVRAGDMDFEESDHESGGCAGGE